MQNHISKLTLLIIDDDRLFCKLVCDHFESDNIKVLCAYSGTEGLRICTQKKVDVVLLDQKLPDGPGIHLCPQILEHNDQVKIIFNTAFPSIENAVKAIKLGAHDYLSKPFEMKELSLRVEKSRRALELEKVEQIQRYHNTKKSEETVMVGHSEALSEVQLLINLAASSEAPVLITGETGCGKGLVARSIHYISSRRKSAFIHINCASLPENLIEAELFGAEKGAYTGADGQKKGIFEMADGGTLFLDEIGTLAPHLQSKLLGVLEDKKIKRLGGNSLLPVDVRILAATNAELENLIQKRMFREDLYYRLNVVRIHVPPLRSRIQDISELCLYFIRQHITETDLKIPDTEIERLMTYKWPGNIRELKNIIERAVILRKSSNLYPSRLLTHGATEPVVSTIDTTDDDVEPLEEIEKKHIRYALGKHAYNRSKTARVLGISRNTLKRKIKTYGLNHHGPS